jgi:hypothetical protein
MRSLLTALTFFCLVSAGHAADDARSIIERAIKARGGAAAIKVAGEAVHVRWKATLYQEGPGGQQIAIQADYEYYRERSCRESTVVRGEANGIKVEFIHASDTKKSWVKANGEVKEQSADEVKWMKENTWYEFVEELDGLLEGKAFTFTALGESKVNDTAVLGVKVSCKGHGDTLLYFDKATGLLVKSSSPYKQESKGGKEVRRDSYFSDYQEVGTRKADERLLKEAGVETTDRALLEFVRKQTPTAANLKKIKDLIRQLGDEAFAVREQASKELVAFGLAAVPALQAARKNRDLEVSRGAARCLLRIAPRRQEARLLAAVRLFAARRVAGACEPLLDLLPGASKPLAEEVRGVLHNLGRQGGKPDPALVAALAGKDAARRTAAREALEKDGGVWARRPGRRLYASGLKYPMKRVDYLDSKKISEKEVADIEFFNRFEDSVFARP